MTAGSGALSAGAWGGLIQADSTVVGLVVAAVVVFAAVYIVLRLRGRGGKR